MQRFSLWFPMEMQGVHKTVRDSYDEVSFLVNAPLPCKHVPDVTCMDNCLTGSLMPKLYAPVSRRCPHASGSPKHQDGIWYNYNALIDVFRPSQTFQAKIAFPKHCRYPYKPVNRTAYTAAQVHVCRLADALRSCQRWGQVVCCREVTSTKC